MKERITRLVEIQEELSTLNRERESIVKSLAMEMYEFEGVMIEVLDDDYFAKVKTFLESQIDVKKLKEEYPDIYELGLITTFDIDTAIKGIDRKLFTEIIEHCSRYVRNYKVAKEKKRNVERAERNEFRK
jgi:predicted phage-related endonuclease